MNELQYLREEYKLTLAAFKNSTSAVISFVLTFLSGILTFLTKWGEISKDILLPNAVLPMVFFIASVCIFVFAKKQNENKLYMIYLQSYIYCYHNTTLKKDTDFQTQTLWENLSYENLFNRDNEECFTWDFAEHSTFMLFLIIFNISWITNQIAVISTNLLLGLFDIVIILMQIAFFIIIIRFGCKKKNEKEREKQISNWIHLGKKKGYFTDKEIEERFPFYQN